jgi:hypothetical protein
MRVVTQEGKHSGCWISRSKPLVSRRRVMGSQSHGGDERAQLCCLENPQRYVLRYPYRKPTQVGR